MPGSRAPSAGDRATDHDFPNYEGNARLVRVARDFLVNFAPKKS